jgi:hypothetical protein
MAIPIPEGYVQLNSGDVIKENDLVSPYGERPFKSITRNVGKKYKVDATLNPSSIVITKKEKESKILLPPNHLLVQKVNSWSPKIINCLVSGITDLNKRDWIYYNVICKYLKIFSYEGDSGKWFFILKDRKLCNFYSSNPQEVDSFKNCKRFTFESFVKYFTPPKIEELIKPADFSLNIEIQE